MNAIQVRALVADVFGHTPLSANRQTFGHRSVTYDVTLPDRAVIVRTNADPRVFATTAANLAILAELGLPVPTVLTSDLTLSRYPFAYMILDKIPGRDLRYEIASMTPEQMARLAEQIVGFQRRVMTLPQGSGFGYVGIGEVGPYRSWWEQICHDNDAPRLPDADPRIAAWQIRISALLLRFEPFLRAVPPTCFLDDITVKNVLIANGELQGLIDFDCICYGDPLYWLALTAVGIVSDVRIRELFYMEELKRIWPLTLQQEPLFALYSAAIALDFLRRFSASETPEWRTRMRLNVEHWLAQAET